jgi:hypothetical protein
MPDKTGCRETDGRSLSTPDISGLAGIRHSTHSVAIWRTMIELGSYGDARPPGRTGNPAGLGRCGTITSNGAQLTVTTITPDRNHPTPAIGTTRHGTSPASALPMLTRIAPAVVCAAGQTCPVTDRSPRLGLTAIHESDRTHLLGISFAVFETGMIGDGGWWCM